MSNSSPPIATAPTRSTPASKVADNAQQIRVSVPRKDRMKFFRQFATCIKAGMSVGAALKHLEAETSNRDLKEAAHKAQICVERGGKLSAWMKTRPHVFSRAESAFILVAEMGGALDAALDRIATDLAEEVNFRRRVFLATFIAKFVIVPLMILVPGTWKFQVYGMNALAKAPAGLSPMEQSRIIAREGFRGYLHETWQLLLPLLLCAAFLYLLWRIMILTPIGRRVADQISLWTPATGPLWRDWAISRYLTALGLLSKAGVVPAAALDACRGLAGNVILDEKFDKAADLAREHNLSIPDALSRVGVLSQTALSLIRTGDHAGAMPEMLGQAADYYESDVRSRLTSVPKIVSIVVFALCAVGVAYIFTTSVKFYFDNTFNSVDRYMEMP